MYWIVNTTRKIIFKNVEKTGSESRLSFNQVIMDIFFSLEICNPHGEKSFKFKNIFLLGNL